MLEVKIKSLLEGAKQAEGIAVLVDIFRAGTNICLVLDKGAERVIPVASLKDSLNLAKENPEYIFIGERDGTKVPQFDYGNSPSEIDMGDFYGKTVSINTTSGTQGIIAARNAEQVLIGGFANSPAIENYIKEEAKKEYDGFAPVPVTIVPIGWKGKTKAFEDEAYALYLRDRLLGNKTSFDGVKKAILKAQFTRRFFDPKDKDFPEKDLEYCLTLGRFNNIPRIYRTNNGLEIRDAYINSQGPF